MKFKLIAYMIFSIGWVQLNIGYGQTAETPTKPVTGKPCPDFTLDKVKYTGQSTIKLADLKGKWTFLDFWTTSCITCIKSFPKINSFYETLGDEMNFILIGSIRKEYKQVEEFYDRMAAKQKLTVPVAFDSVLMRKWQIYSVPYILIIDPQGIVQYITGGRNLTLEKLRMIMAGKEVDIYRKDTPLTEATAQELLVTSDNRDSILYASILTPWSGQRQRTGYEFKEFVSFKAKYILQGWSVTMMPLFGLYNYAFWGKAVWLRNDPLYGNVWPYPILELTDSSAFFYDFKNDVGKGTYNYSLKLPHPNITEQKLKDILQHELKIAFGYQTTIGQRDMPIWKLVALPGADQKLKSKGGDFFLSPGAKAAGFEIRNGSIEKVLSIIAYHLEENKVPFIDATEIDFSIDMKLDAEMTNLDQVQQALKPYNLTLIKATKPMKVLVITDY